MVIVRKAFVEHSCTLAYFFQLQENFSKILEFSFLKKKKKKGIFNFFNFATLEKNCGGGDRILYLIEKDISLQIKF